MAENSRIKMVSELSNSEALAVELEKLPASGLSIEIKPSPLLIKIYIIFFIMLLASLLSLPISLWLMVPLILISTIYFQQIFRQHLLFNHNQSIKKIVLTEMDWCFILFNNTKILKATILPDSILSEHLVILNLQDVAESSFFAGEGHLLLTADGIGKNNFWKLKRYLRFKKFDFENEKADLSE